MLEIRPATMADYPAIREIFQQGIDMGDATFQTRAPNWQEWDESKLSTCRLVAYEQKQLSGWAALAAVSGLQVFSGIAEVSIYIADQAQGNGIGQRLLTELIHCSEQNGFWILQAAIFPENQASLNLHQKNGFKILGVREKMGQMHGIWRDVVLLERRSKIVGVPANSNSNAP